MEANYCCPSCEKRQFTLKEHRKHIRSVHMPNHFKLREYKFKCQHCQNDTAYCYFRYSDHIKKCGPGRQQTMEFNEDNVDFGDVSAPPTSNDSSTTNVNLEDTTTLLLDLKEMCYDFWLNLLGQPAITRKTVDQVCSQHYQIISRIVDSYKNDSSKYGEAKKQFDELWKSSKTEYLRHKELQASPTFISPTHFALSDRMEMVANREREQMILRIDHMATVSIKKTLLCVLQNPSIFNSLEWPSNFSDSSNYSHVFASNRAQELYQVITLTF